MTEVKLGLLIAPARTVRLGTGRILPILSMTMRNGLVDQEGKFKKRIASADLAPYKVVRSGQLVVGFPIDEAVLAVQRLHPAGIVSPAYAVWDIDREVADDRYLELFLRSPRAISYYTAKLQGSTARRRSLPNEVFLDMDVPLPPLHEQRRIASILDRTDAVRSGARQVLRAIQAMRESLFVQNFGSIETATTQTVVKLGAVSTISSGSTPDRGRPDYFGGAIPWVKTTEVRGSVIEQTSEHVTEAGMRAARLRLFPKGSIAIAMYGQGKTRGRVATLGLDAAVNQACAVVMPNEALDGEYLFEHLKMSYERIRSQARGGNQANLNLGLVADIDVIVPALQLQREFGANNRKLTSLALKEAARSLLLDELFTSLQHRAFKSEL